MAPPRALWLILVADMGGLWHVKRLSFPRFIIKKKKKMNQRDQMLTDISHKKKECGILG